MNNTNNNYAFIDSQNVNLGIKRLGWKLDFARLRIYLADKYGIAKAFLFLGYLPSHKDLYSFLERSGYDCIFKPILMLPNRTVKGNVDAELVLHTMIQYPNFEQGLIATGDGDFYCLAEYLKQQNKLLKILIPDQERYSALLKAISTTQDNLLDFMNDLRGKLEDIPIPSPVQNEKGSCRDETLREPLTS